MQFKKFQFNFCVLCSIYALDVMSSNWLTSGASHQTRFTGCNIKVVESVETLYKNHQDANFQRPNSMTSLFDKIQVNTINTEFVRVIFALQIIDNPGIVVQDWDHWHSLSVITNSWSSRGHLQRQRSSALMWSSFLAFIEIGQWSKDWKGKRESSRFERVTASQRMGHLHHFMSYISTRGLPFL